VMLSESRPSGGAGSAPCATMLQLSNASVRVIVLGTAIPRRLAERDSVPRSLH
jgi:hypothetical protein